MNNSILVLKERKMKSNVPDSQIKVLESIYTILGSLLGGSFLDMPCLTNEEERFSKEGFLYSTAYDSKTYVVNFETYDLFVVWHIQNGECCCPLRISVKPNKEKLCWDTYIYFQYNGADVETKLLHSFYDGSTYSSFESREVIESLTLSKLLEEYKHINKIQE